MEDEQDVLYTITIWFNGALNKHSGLLFDTFTITDKKIRIGDPDDIGSVDYSEYNRDQIAGFEVQED